jgi:hypothetical protein
MHTGARLDPHVTSGSTVAAVDEATYTVGALAKSSGLTIEVMTMHEVLHARASLKRIYSKQGAEQASRGAMSPGLQEYVGRAMEARGA